jgi:beta-1,2-mannobiose phosphorylase / 1,2-beta-oligomannan phosphorylase
MFSIKRSIHNPIIKPGSRYQWETSAAFNWSAVKDKKDKKTIHCVYRAISEPNLVPQHYPYISTIGYARSTNGISYNKRSQLVKPEFAWERYGCEDPRITELNGKYYIFYTALSAFPFRYFGIKVACAVTRDFKTIESKHLVTPFNAKAMALFPATIGGKLTAILTANTDNAKRTARIAIAQFDHEDEIWDISYWRHWYKRIGGNTLHIRRSATDHVEVGAAPIKTKYGWLLVYAHIQNYPTDHKIFGIEALLLDIKDPRKIIGRTKHPIMIPVEGYEKYGQVPNVIFPSGALIKDKMLSIFYGAADTTSCLAEVRLDNLLRSMKPEGREGFCMRFNKNPIIAPVKKHSWESNAVFNPAAIDLDGRIHIIYRASAGNNTSTMGYAVSRNGFNIDERLPMPVYIPRLDFEMKKIINGNSGCEDPRIVKIGNTLYMFYTAYNGITVPRVAMTCIPVNDFLKRKWNWSRPVLVTPAGIDDKDACIFPEKIAGKYCFIHRIRHNICIDFWTSFRTASRETTRGIMLMRPRYGMWDSKKIGLAGPPLKTKAGWLMFYHGIGEDLHYRLGAALLDIKNPLVMLSRTDEAILEPVKRYEKHGQVPNVVFPCAHILRGDTIYHYYGAADSVIGVATQRLSKILSSLVF